MHFTSYRKSITVVMAALMALMALGSARSTSAQGQTGRLRFVHGVPGGPAVDIAVDKGTVARGLNFMDATRYVTAPVGDHVVTISADGKPVFEGQVKLAPAQALTVLAQGTASSVEVGVYEDDLSPTAPGKQRFTAIHAIKDAPAIDILKVEGSPLIQGLKYAEPHGAFDIPAMAQAFAVAAAGGDVSGALVKTPPLSLVAGTSNILVVLGTVDKPGFLLLTATCDADKPDASELVRFAHGLPGGPAVDVYIGSDLVAPGLAYGTATAHVALAAGKTTVSVRSAGSGADSAPLVTKDLTLTGGKAATVVLAGSASAPAVTVVDDNNGKLDPTVGRVQVINVTGSPISAQFSAGGNVTKVSADSGKAVAPSELPATEYDVTVGGTSDSAPQASKLPVSGGVLYDLIAVGNNKVEAVIVAATSLNESLNSAPVPVSLLPTSSAPALATQPPTNAPAAATQASTNVSAPATPVPATATPTSVPAAATVSAQPPTAASPTKVPGIVAVVITNEGVNLKVREYPSINARTLVLVPSGTSLTVLGVRGVVSTLIRGKGTSTVTPTFTLTPSPTPTGTFVPPSTVSDIWLYVSWAAPDGGTVKGWINAQFVRITKDGRAITKDADILAFKQIPEDTPGEVNSSVTPVSNTINIIGTVSNVDPNVNVQIRRQPNITAESLGLLPAGSTVIVLAKTEIKTTPVVGSPASPIWLFIRFDTDTGSTFGWVNSQYFTLTRNKAALDVAQVPTATDITPGYTTGTVSTGGAAGGPTTAAPAGLVATVDKIQPGANLQLRDRDDANGTSLALIPQGTQLQVLGRNGAGTWIQVQYNDQTGWVSVNFVSLTRSGKAIKVTDLKNVSSEPDTVLTPGANLTPTAAH